MNRISIQEISFSPLNETTQVVCKTERSATSTDDLHSSLGASLQTAGLSSVQSRPSTNKSLYVFQFYNYDPLGRSGHSYNANIASEGSLTSPGMKRLEAACRFYVRFIKNASKKGGGLSQTEKKLITKKSMTFQAVLETVRV